MCVLIGSQSSIGVVDASLRLGTFVKDRDTERPPSVRASTRNADDFCVVRRHARLISRWIGTRDTYTHTECNV